MEVIYKSQGEVEYRRIRCGQCFMVDKHPMIKTDADGISGLMSIDLVDGISYSYPAEFMVTQLEAHIIVERR